MKYFGTSWYLLAALLAGNVLAEDVMPPAAETAPVTEAVKTETAKTEQPIEEQEKKGETAT